MRQQLLNTAIAAKANFRAAEVKCAAAHGRSHNKGKSEPMKPPFLNFGSLSVKANLCEAQVKNAHAFGRSYKRSDEAAIS
jgi:hypothetical protein